MEFTSIYEFCKHISDEIEKTGAEKFRVVGYIDGEMVTDTTYNLKDGTQEVIYFNDGGAYGKSAEDCGKAANCALPERRIYQN